jgi:3-hydroxyacyl-CoA dehydrogenase
MKIAVVGAGFTGATIANLLAPSHDVTVFEERPVDMDRAIFEAIECVRKFQS